MSVLRGPAMSLGWRDARSPEGVEHNLAVTRPVAIASAAVDWISDIRWLPILLALVPLLMDMALHARDWPRWFQAVLDETGHSATTLVLLFAFSSLRGRRISLPVFLAVLSGGIFIDVDHIPYEIFGSEVLMGDAIRPYSHSITTLLVLVALAVAAPGLPRNLLLAVAFGVATHLIRDMATNGVPLFWPVNGATVELSYQTYTIMLFALALLNLQRGARQT